VLEVTANKCYLEEMKSPTSEQLSRSKEILYYSQLRW